MGVTLEAKSGAMAEDGRLPSFIIIGAMKCATTSLHYYLGCHPQIFTSVEKELNFFADSRKWSRGMDWYRQQFRSSTLSAGESSPIYTDFPFTPDVPRRINAAAPNVKLIYLVRDPVDRLVSHYVHECASGEESRSFADVVAAGMESVYAGRSRYFFQVAQYLKFFPREQLLVVDQDELRFSRVSVLRKVFEFLEVDPDFVTARFGSERHRSNQKRRLGKHGRIIQDWLLRTPVRRLPESIRWHVLRLALYPFSTSVRRPALPAPEREQIEAWFHDDVAALRAFTGHSFASWSL